MGSDMTRLTDFDAGERFGLVIQPTCYSASDDSSLGRGGGEQTMVFQSAESRAYFKRLYQSQEREESLRRELKSIKRRLAECFTRTKRVRRKKLLALMASLELGSGV